MDQRENPASDDPVELATQRYQTAFAVYQCIVEENTEMTMTGDKLSRRARLEEERAFEELDSARFALFVAAAVAFPTIL